MNRRRILVAACVLAGFAATPVRADPYRWCAVYSGDGSGGSNCGFVTLEQCRATVSGIGGSCQPNQFYTGREDEPKKRKPRR
jgi:hypothetical protein